MKPRLEEHPEVQTQEPPRASADEARALPNKVVTGGVFQRRFSGFRNGQKRGRAASDAGSVSVVGQTHVRSEGVRPQTTGGRAEYRYSRDYFAQGFKG